MVRCCGRSEHCQAESTSTHALPQDLSTSCLFSTQGYHNIKGLSLEASFTPDSQFVLSGEGVNYIVQRLQRAVYIRTYIPPMCLFEFGIPGSAMIARFELAHLKLIHVQSVLCLVDKCYTTTPIMCVYAVLSLCVCMLSQSSTEIWRGPRKFAINLSDQICLIT